MDPNFDSINLKCTYDPSKPIHTQINPHSKKVF
jgi:hypothetical protein